MQSPVSSLVRADAYIDDVCIPNAGKLPIVKVWSMPLTGSVKGIAFAPAQIERVFVKAKELGPSGKAACRTIIQSWGHQTSSTP